MIYVSKQFFSWFFIDAPKAILSGWRNFILFYLDYFSTPLLLKTLFSHWHKYAFSYGRKFDLMEYAGTFFFNLLSRIMGALLRIFLIIIGFVFEAGILIIGFFIFLGWFLLPLILILGFALGLNMVIY